MIRLPKEYSEKSDISKNISLEQSHHIDDLKKKYGNSVWIARVARREIEKETSDLSTRLNYLKMMDGVTSRKINQTKKLAEELQENKNEYYIKKERVIRNEYI